MIEQVLQGNLTNTIPNQNSSNIRIIENTGSNNISNNNIIINNNHHNQRLLQKQQQQQQRSSNSNTTYTSSSNINDNRNVIDVRNDQQSYDSNYPITLSIICAINIIHYYRIYHERRKLVNDDNKDRHFRHQRRSQEDDQVQRRRRRQDQQHEHHTSTHESNLQPDIIQSTTSSSSTTMLIPYSYVTYRILIHYKQIYRWLLALFSIQQYTTMSTSKNSTNQHCHRDDESNGNTYHSTDDDDNDHDGSNYDDDDGSNYDSRDSRWPLLIRRRRHQGSADIGNINDEDHNSSSSTNRTSLLHRTYRLIRQSIYSIRNGGIIFIRSIIQIYTYLYRLFDNNNHSNNHHTLSFVERIQILYNDMTNYYYNILSHQQRIQYSSLLLLFYVSYLLWSCRTIENFYRYYYNFTSSSSSSSILTYVYVWFGIALCATIWELYVSYFAIQILYSIHQFIIRRVHEIVAQQQRDRIGSHNGDINDTSTTTTPTTLFSLNTSSNEQQQTIEPDIVPLFVVTSSQQSNSNTTDTDTDLINRIYNKMTIIQKCESRIKDGILCTNIIQMISSLLMIHRCIVINSNDNIISETMIIHNHSLPIQQQLQQEVLLSIPKIISPIPLIWPSTLLGHNISYVTCLFLLFWLSLSPLSLDGSNSSDGATTREHQQQESRTLPRGSIDYHQQQSTLNNSIENNNDNADSTPKSTTSRSARYIFLSITYGTIIGWVWGNSIFIIDNILITPYVGNAVLITLLIGTIISLKVQYPNAYILSWLHHPIGCTNLGEMLIYDIQSNQWIHDDTLSNNDGSSNEDVNINTELHVNGTNRDNDSIEIDRNASTERDIYLDDTDIEQGPLHDFFEQSSNIDLEYDMNDIYD